VIVDDVRVVSACVDSGQSTKGLGTSGILERDNKVGIRLEIHIPCEGIALLGGKLFYLLVHMY